MYSYLHYLYSRVATSETNKKSETNLNKIKSFDLVQLVKFTFFLITYIKILNFIDNNFKKSGNLKILL